MNYKKVCLGVLAAAVLLFTLFRFTAAPEEPRPKVGFITLGDVHAPGWNASNYEGILAACDALGVELLVRDHVRVNSGMCPQAIRELAAEGCGMIFLGSYSYSVEAQSLVDEYPGIAFAINSAEIHRPNMTAYFVRFYQARYLAGALAAMKTKSGVLGYVAAMQNSEVNRGVNAFALGARRVNPNVRVVVAWTGAWEDPAKEAALAERLIREQGADVLTYHQDDDAAAETADRLGAHFIAYNAPIPNGTKRGLAAVRCRWDVFYTDVLCRFLKGELNAVKNHWIGIDRDAVALTSLSIDVEEKERIQLDALRQELVNQRLVFLGPLYDNGGSLRCGASETISDDTLLESMNWLVQGVKILE